MWVPLGHKHYIVKKEILENDYSIFLSDFVHLWVSRLKNEEMVAVSKEMNPLIEAPDSKLLDKVLSLFDGNAVTKKILTENDNMILHLQSDLSGIKFNFKIELELLNAEMFFKEITLPFMLLAARLQIREKKLIEIILKKDAEINEYKREHGEIIKRSHLITKVFKRSELMEGELEESNSSFASIMNDPSAILNIIDVAMFESAKSHKLKEDQPNQTERVGDCDSIQRESKTNVKIKKSRSRIDLHINAGATKKRDKFNLKL